MQRIQVRRPSPAVAISLAALVVASSGTAFASGPIASIAKALGLSGKQKNQVTSIVDKQIAAKAPGLNVLSAATATNASTATNATNAGNATTLGGQGPSTFFPASRVLSTGTVATLPDSTPTATTLLRAGPFTLQGTCTVSGSVVTLYFYLDFPANTIYQTTPESTAGTLELDHNVSTDLTTPNFDSSLTGLFDSYDQFTLIAPDGTAYEFLDGWDGVNYPSSGTCAYQALLVQG
jgi:hypothetical protein